MTVDAHFSELFFTDCTFGEPQAEGQRLVLPCRDLGLMPGHPLNKSGKLSYVPNAKLIFDEVRSSRRTVSEYLRGPKENAFKAAATVIDGPFPPVSGEVSRFELEGVVENPPAWTGEWIIEAVRFTWRYDLRVARHAAIFLRVGRAARPRGARCTAQGPEPHGCEPPPLAAARAASFALSAANTSARR